MTTRYDELLADALEYHKQHPQVWDMFVDFTNDRIKRGFKNYSAYAIFERIRWETDAADSADPDADEFVLNNNYRPFYARWFMENFPEYEGFFRIRKQTSREKPATHQAPLKPSNYPYVSMKDEREATV
jgi:hypothetical protein